MGVACVLREDRRGPGGDADCVLPRVVGAAAVHIGTPVPAYPVHVGAYGPVVRGDH